MSKQTSTKLQDPIPESMRADVERIVAGALAEDLGAKEGPGDITTKLLIPEATKAKVHFAAREGLVVCGSFVAAEVYRQLDPTIEVKILVEDGTLVAEGTPLVKINGPARPILTGERVVLNLMQRMCGIATLTHVYVDAVSGTKAIILDTRKTMPGLRLLDKYAVRTGGGENHRMGLYDMVLIKDNHIALSGSIGEAAIKARSGSKLPLVIECDTLEQVEEAVKVKPDRILLDNMDVIMMHQAVALVGGKVPLEASGGVSLDRVRAIAMTGVDFISVGKLTHSAPAADIGADIAYS